MLCSVCVRAHALPVVRVRKAYFGRLSCEVIESGRINLGPPSKRFETNNNPQHAEVAELYHVWKTV